jgi:hypothetical protein
MAVSHSAWGAAASAAVLSVPTAALAMAMAGAGAATIVALTCFVPQAPYGRCDVSAGAQRAGARAGGGRGA